MLCHRACGEKQCGQSGGREGKTVGKSLYCALRGEREAKRGNQV